MNSKWPDNSWWYLTIVIFQSFLKDVFMELTLAAAMTTLSNVLWPLDVTLRGLVEAQTFKSPSGSHTISNEDRRTIYNTTTANNNISD